MDNYIRIHGARENNLKNINIDIPRDKLIVLTGLSGSGKSSLAFDTIYAEGQRRYVESLSSYARMFLGQVDKPDIDHIDGLSPSIAIDQKTTVKNPRSTVGTVTEIYDYLRLLFARVGVPYCPTCGKPIVAQSIDQITDKLTSNYMGDKIFILAPVVRGRKGEFAKLLDSFRKAGFVRVIVDDITYELEEDIPIDKNVAHNIYVVIDRMILRDNNLSRLSDSCEQALKLADGLLVVRTIHKSEDINGNIIEEEKDEFFSQLYSCPDCGFSINEMSIRMFSFNTAFGACPKCFGLGSIIDVDPELCVQDPKLSINDGAIRTAGWNFDDKKSWGRCFIEALSQNYNFSLDVPYIELPKEVKDLILFGNDGKKMLIDTRNSAYSRGSDYYSAWEGVVPSVMRRYRESSSPEMKQRYEEYMNIDICPDCNGSRLKKESLSIRVGNKNIYELTCISIKDLVQVISGLKLSNREMTIAKPIIDEILKRLEFLIDVGLEYMTLSRSASTLSGGEAQRIRLATQIGSGLKGVLYILDEPSIGLHQRDNTRLIDTLCKLRDLGNTVIVVEHDEETIRAADFVVDIGPEAGVNGGEVVAQGKVEDIIKSPNSLTGKYLSGEKFIPVPINRRKALNGYINIKNAHANNLKNIDVDVPLGCFTCITGVSGSGKSSLINSTLVPYLSHKLNGAKKVKVKCDEIKGYSKLNKLIVIDQSPIGKTPRSNPATYIGVFDLIRQLFTNTPEAKARGYKAGRFSFNVKGGRCEACQGDGVNRIEMHFLPDVYVKCDVCAGRRYNHETLEVKYKGKNIADILDMTVDEAVEFFYNIPNIFRKVKVLQEVGLGYIKLGQPSTQLSGGEAQRVKLASELSKRSTGKTIYVLDEPTTGLHVADVHKLIDILERLTANNNTVVVIEHNLDVIKTSDYIIDIGPESGDNGGTVLAKGTPEQIAKSKLSHTGRYLKEILKEAKNKNQYMDISVFLDVDKLKEEAMEIEVGPKVWRKIKEDTN